MHLIYSGGIIIHMINFAVFISEYFWWHYTKAIGEIFDMWKNFLWFLSHYFSIRIFLKTLAAPMWRLQEKGGRGFRPEEWAQNFLMNIMMRIVGFFARSFMLIIGFSVLTLTFVSLPFVMILWLALPALVPVLFFGGLIMIL